MSFINYLDKLQVVLQNTASNLDNATCKSIVTKTKTLMDDVKVGCEEDCRLVISRLINNIEVNTSIQVESEQNNQPLPNHLNKFTNSMVSILTRKYINLIKLFDLNLFETTAFEMLYDKYVGNFNTKHITNQYWSLYYPVLVDPKLTYKEIVTFVTELYNTKPTSFITGSYRYFSFFVSIGYETPIDVPRVVLARMQQCLWAIHEVLEKHPRDTLEYYKLPIDIDNPNLGKFNIKLPLIKIQRGIDVSTEVEVKPAFLGDYVMKEPTLKFARTKPKKEVKIVHRKKIIIPPERMKNV